MIIFKQYAHYLDSISENVSINYTYNIWSIIHIFDHRQNNIEHLFNNLAIFAQYLNNIWKVYQKKVGIIKTIFVQFGQQYFG